MTIQENNWFWREVHATDTEMGVVQGCSSLEKHGTSGQDNGQLRGLLRNHGNGEKEKVISNCDWVQRKVWLSRKISMEAVTWKSALDAAIHLQTNGDRKNTVGDWLQGEGWFQGRDSLHVCWVGILYLIAILVLSAGDHGCREEMLEMG